MKLEQELPERIWISEDMARVLASERPNSVPKFQYVSADLAAVVPKSLHAQALRIVEQLRAQFDDEQSTIDAVALIESALAAVVPLPQWQPIETAPKDGKPVILKWPHWNTKHGIVGAFNQRNRGNQWEVPEVKYHSGPPPTGWMPLPEINGPALPLPQPAAIKLRKPWHTKGDGGCVFCDNYEPNGIYPERHNELTFAPAKSGLTRIDCDGYVHCEIQSEIMVYSCNGCDWRKAGRPELPAIASPSAGFRGASSEYIRGLEQAAKDVCMFCGERAAGYEAATGPNSGGNYTHESRNKAHLVTQGQLGIVLCAATPIHARLRALVPVEAQPELMDTLAEVLGQEDVDLAELEESQPEQEGEK